jgi:hypothetical protein
MLHKSFTRNAARRTALFLIVTLLVSSLSVFAQDKKKQDKDKQKRAAEEKLKSVYKRWVNEDVLWIITEKSAKRSIR